MQVCKQQDKVLEIKNVMDKGVDVFKPWIRSKVKGVVYNLSLEAPEQELSSCLKGGNVIAAKLMGGGENTSPSYLYR